MSRNAQGNSVSLEMLDEELAALTEAGNYGSSREVMRDALEIFLDANPALRLEMAIKLWQQQKISMGRAVELAQCDRETFKAELAARGINVVIDTDTEDFVHSTELIKRIRRDNDSV